MKKVLIIKNWQSPDIFRQTSKGKGIWRDVKFSLDYLPECDYVIVINYPLKNYQVATYPQNIWTILQEPPNEFFKPFHETHKIYRRVFTTDQDLKEERYIHAQPALPWLISKDYDFLVDYLPEEKPFVLSCIISRKRRFKGHRGRIEFIKKTKDKLSLDLVATYEYLLGPKAKNKKERKKIQLELKKEGYNKILEDKWEGLAPYRYSLILENWQGPYYWSEKLSDCFLTWTMPIYFGCTNIADYFPKDSLVQIDINDSRVVEKIENTIKSDLWLERRKEIEKARKLVLQKYQFFPFFYDQIKKWEKKFPLKSLKKKEMIIPHESKFFNRLRFKVGRLLKKLNYTA